MRAASLLLAATCALLLASAALAATYDQQLFSSDNCVDGAVGALPTYHEAGVCTTVEYSSSLKACSADGSRLITVSYSGPDCVAGKEKGYASAKTGCRRSSALYFEKTFCNGTVATPPVFPTAAAAQLSTTCFNMTDYTNQFCGTTEPDNTIICTDYAGFPQRCFKSSADFSGSYNMVCSIALGSTLLQYSDDACTTPAQKFSIAGKPTAPIVPPAPKCPVVPFACSPLAAAYPPLPTAGLIQFTGDVNSTCVAPANTTANVVTLYTPNVCADNQKLVCTATSATLTTYALNKNPANCSGEVVSTITSVQPAGVCTQNQRLLCDVTAAAAAAGVTIPASSPSGGGSGGNGGSSSSGPGGPSAATSTHSSLALLLALAGSVLAALLL